MIIPDTNLLMYAYNTGSILHSDAKKWWEKILNSGSRIGIPWVVSSGFIRLMTHRKVLDSPIKFTSALEIVEGWMSFDQVSPINPGNRHLAIFREMLEAAGVGGNLVTDAHIAAIGVEYQAEVHSNDSDFGRFPGLKWINPIIVTKRP